ncbi:hypothetical protein [Novosphingobium sp. JCM 18896]|uniref:hypothetical protein n=1 Tax=Novosphingobium sp. JCM 18896 TaxID=2989731 RepID=UPI002222DC4F|nr:hypothetical protein [Novosphingobium sp. JCM 18896]MCW1431983.1 hypothetical protein [Novosphingobium sp. JCM 18896]
MIKKFEIGRFDLDIQLRDEALDERNSPARRMVANASIGIEPFDAYYSTRELREAVEGVHEGRIGAKKRLARILGTECDDYQRCLYYQLAGRGVIQMLEVLTWLEALLGKRTVISADLFRAKEWPAVMVNPYVAAQPDGPLVSADPDFEEGPSWYLDPDLGGVIEE